MEEQKVKNRKIVSLVLLGMFMSLFLGMAGGVMAIELKRDTSLVSIDSSSSNSAAPVTADEEAITAVAREVSKSVVSIVASVRGGGPYSLYESGAGTGIILSSDGYIMTNNHVVSGSSQVSVILSNGKEYKNVTKLGSDPLNDIAFLKINNVSGLTPAKIGNSSSVRIGQTVVAIGNALGQFQTTVTSGIISAKGRPLVASTAGGAPEQLTDLLQTDAAINSGNSGGPLVDLAGRVIGINTAIATDANNIGFAIPINAEKGVIKSVLESGEVKKVFLGVSYTGVTPDVAEREGLSVDRGAYIAKDGNVITRDGPAYKAGVKPGDVITKVDGKKVGENGGLGSIIGEYQPGDKIKLTIFRGGKTLELEVELGTYRR